MVFFVGVFCCKTNKQTNTRIKICTRYELVLQSEEKAFVVQFLKVSRLSLALCLGDSFSTFLLFLFIAQTRVAEEVSGVPNC